MAKPCLLSLLGFSIIWSIVGFAYSSETYDMGCECGKREVDEEKEKKCQETALLESPENVRNHHQISLMLKT